MGFYRPTWVDISLDAYLSNLKSIKKWIGPQVKLLSVLKADAYGHSAELLLKNLPPSAIDMIGVSSLEEGIYLRDKGVKLPILILGGIYPLDNFSVALDYQLIPTVASLDAAQQLSKISADKHMASVACHVKVDTGMGRIGVSVEGARFLFEWLKNQTQVQLAGVYSHFSSADSDLEFSQHQIQLFNEIKSWVVRNGFNDVMFHLSNSAGVLLGSTAHFDMVRPGLLAYGLSPRKDNLPFSVQPVLSWNSKVVFVKRVPAGTPISYGRTYVTKQESDIITIPVGYADGVSRHVSNKGFVLIKGQRRPIIGRVTMDHIMVDVTGMGVNVGDPVVLIGQQGQEKITAEEWAQWADTIPYEIVCGISKRVPRKLVS